MDIKQLRYFLAVAEERSFSRAAERLHISQPPLSQQIMKLEQELGVRLFARTTRSFELTPAGRALMEEGMALMAQMDKAVSTVRQVDRGETGRLRMGVVGSAMWSGLLAVLADFRRDYPRVAWTLHELDPAAQQEALRLRGIDIGFWRAADAEAQPAGAGGVTREACFREAYRAVLPAGHPLAGRRRLRLQDLAGEPLLSLPLDRSAEARYLLQHCVEAGFPPMPFQQAGEPQTLLALIGAGLGVALLPESASRVGWPDVVFVPIDPAPVADLHVAWRAGEDGTDAGEPVVKAFLEVLRRHRSAGPLAAQRTMESRRRRGRSV